MKGEKNSQISQNVRERLLKSALKLFSQKGYAASIREIAEDSITTLPSIYYYFGSKEGLYKALMQEHLSVIEALMEDDDHSLGSAREKLVDFINVMYLKTVDDLEFMRLMHIMSYGPPKGAPPFNIEPYYRRFHNFISRIISAGIEKGEFRPGNANHMAYVVQGALQQMLSEDLCFGSIGNSHHKELQDILEIILDGFQRGQENK